MSQVLQTWAEIASYLRRSVSWAKKAHKENGMPVITCKGIRGPHKRVWTTRTLLDVWICKWSLEQRKS